VAGKFIPFLGLWGHGVCPHFRGKKATTIMTEERVDYEVLKGLDLEAVRAALKVDDQQREDAINSLRALVDDYEEAIQLYEAGNLGTVEL
jgi:hypothetical protein